MYRLVIFFSILVVPIYRSLSPGVVSLFVTGNSQDMWYSGHLSDIAIWRGKELLQIVSIKTYALQKVYIVQMLPVGSKLYCIIFSALDRGVIVLLPE